jgi:hypothetical protein
VQANCRAATATIRSSLFAISLCVRVSLCIRLSRALLVCWFRGSPCFALTEHDNDESSRTLFPSFLDFFAFCWASTSNVCGFDQFCCKIPGGSFSAHRSRVGPARMEVSSFPWFLLCHKP